MASSMTADFGDHTSVKEIYFATQYQDKLACLHGFYDLFE